MSTEIVSDRLIGLQKQGEAGVERLFRRLPMVADAVRGHGPLAGHGRIGYVGSSLSPVKDWQALARLLAHDRTIQLALMSATKFERHLLGLAVWYGGRMTAEMALALAGDNPPTHPMLDQAAEGLADLFLSDPDRGWVALRPGVEEWVPLSGVRLRPEMDRVTSDAIARMLKNLGVESGSRKTERIDALEAALRERNVVRAALSRLDPDETHIMRQLLDGAVHRAPRIGFSYSQRTPLERLADRGLIGIDYQDLTCWVWLDVMVGLSGALADDWAIPPRSEISFATPPVSVPAVAGRLELLLDLWDSSPAAALKSGGLGVSPIKAAAKVLGVSAGEIGLLAAVAIDLNLLVKVIIRSHGRGRNQTVDQVWRPGPAAAGWKAKPLWWRWARLVQQWRDSQILPGQGKLVDRVDPGARDIRPGVARDFFVRALAELEPGVGMAATELAAWLPYRHLGLFTPAIAAQLLAETRFLGLVPPTGPVGLTGAGRCLLEGAGALEAATAGNVREFTVQADHTVVALPGLAGEVMEQLTRFAELESETGALIFRITDRRLVAALDNGVTADQMLGFLRTHSTVAVAPNVERSIRDASDRHGRIRVGEAVSWLAADDPALLSRSVAVKGARLTALSPTIAISTLPSDKLLAALRTAGLAPIGPDRKSPIPEVHPKFAAQLISEPRPRVLGETDFPSLAVSLAKLPAADDEPILPEASLLDFWDELQEWDESDGGR